MQPALGLAIVTSKAPQPVEYMHFVIAIPTFNRLPQLRQALDAIAQLRVPGGMRLTVAISNIASVDGTSEFLDTLKLPNAEVCIHNEPDARSRLNFVFLSKVVPADADWVWLHGDDDRILRSNALEQVARVLGAEGHEDASLLVVPQAKRTRATGRTYAGKTLDLCNTHGFHEIMGWISQLLMRGTVYHAAMEALEKSSVSITFDESLTANRNSPFHLASLVLHQVIDRATILYDEALIDEQVPESAKPQATATARKLENLHDRFFLVIDDLIAINPDLRGKCTHLFLRYVNKYFEDLLIHIAADDALHAWQTPITLTEKLQCLRRLPSILIPGADRDMVQQKIEEACALAEAFVSSPTPPVRAALEELYVRSKRPVFPLHILLE